ncbi:hypothetical protein J2853_008735 [Streptosporangium lutulentum]|uniref:Uncharacterized protein n=1 Tax=Streptosporangium lutulentum TaxID=1461250 RepID=A0ABT9QS07_9ACTN|nr:hypothetical protein [Streptosporangium lutulentum]
MSIPEKSGLRWTNRGSVLVRRFGGIIAWLTGDNRTIKAAADTNGSLGFIEATVSPGGGPVAHAR